MQIAVKALGFCKECFGCDYHLPKLDLLAISDLDCNAMENWGLITLKSVQHKIMFSRAQQIVNYYYTLSTLANYNICVFHHSYNNTAT